MSASTGAKSPRSSPSPAATTSSTTRPWPLSAGSTRSPSTARATCSPTASRTSLTSESSRTSSPPGSPPRPRHSARTLITTASCASTTSRAELASSAREVVEAHEAVVINVLAEWRGRGGEPGGLEVLEDSLVSEVLDAVGEHVALAVDGDLVDPADRGHGRVVEDVVAAGLGE